MEKIFATIAMPLYNMGQIATLAIEGLCNQKTSYKWELIVCEEKNEKSLGEEKLLEYKDKLYSAGCVNIKYIGLDEWIPLGQKWKILSENSSDTKCFILQAGDCYSHNLRIEKTCDAFYNKDCDYYDEQKGYFYSYKFNKTILFNPNKEYTHNCRLNMAWKTSLIKKLPTNDKRRNVDSFLYISLSGIQKINKYRCFDLHEDGVDIDGYNTISSRDNFFTKKSHIFQDVDIDLLEKIPILKNFIGLSLNKNKIK